MARNYTPVEEKIITARIGLLTMEPFFGNLATRMVIVDKSDSLQTAATDGRNLYYNEEFFMNMTKEELTFVLCHEVLHLAYDHLSRRGSRDPKLWNMAADYVINLELRDHNIGKMPNKITIDGKTRDFTGCIDDKFRGMSADEVYSLLEEEQKNGGGQGRQCFDEHPEGNKNQDGSDMTESEKQSLREEIRNAVAQAAMAAGKEKTPASIRAMLDQLANPKMSWRELLEQHLQSMFKSDYSYSRPNRKMMQSGFILPGMVKDPALECVIAIDTSGSMSDEMLYDIKSEIMGIMEQFNDYTIHMFCWDTGIHNPAVFTPDNIDEFMAYQCGGGGGTDVNVVWEYLMENEIEPKRLVVFTDGYFSDSYGVHADYCETLWVYHSNPGFEPEFGMAVEYDFD